ncbi:MAG: C2H2-type zinc finger protein [Thermodesulfobium sp.]
MVNVLIPTQIFHQVIDLADEKYVCKVCNMSFSTQEELQEHGKKYHMH